MKTADGARMPATCTGFRCNVGYDLTGDVKADEDDPHSVEAST